MTEIIIETKIEPSKHPKIIKLRYRHFAEHLGCCIYAVIKQ
ncbi:MAG: hypothetical protein ACXAEX_18320 [Promethearchaeota archaeon]|jgi:hypothetical protein